MIPKKNQNYWAGIIQQFNQSPQKAKIFCEQRGLKLWTFYLWKRRLSLANKQGKAHSLEESSQKSSFVEAVLKASPIEESPTVLKNPKKTLADPRWVASVLAHLWEIQTCDQ